MSIHTTRTQTAVVRCIDYSSQNGKGDMVGMPGLQKKLHIPYDQAWCQSVRENVGYVVWLDIGGTDARFNREIQLASANGVIPWNGFIVECDELPTFLLQKPL